jgi:hypothetical protein
VERERVENGDRERERAEKERESGERDDGNEKTVTAQEARPVLCLSRSFSLFFAVE